MRLRGARNAALTLIAEPQDSTEASQSIRLLNDCRTAFGTARALPSAVIVNRLRADDESLWAETPAPGGITVRRLAAMLREYDITPKNHRWEDGSQSKGYLRDDFVCTSARSASGRGARSQMVRPGS
ncbi:DUF3631 domain-containing protein [Kribbella sp. NPDC056861]|uniref:DUF3631 domain-containing protein n=1 Tax=Kribbella sp. NPDC056861 TaxID=3154857 RepID=UPI003415E887